ncbi:Hypothetical predicted protein [Pelobates cultripes]|uniref:Uncharacterized protein n=1 Tax=Pelobates cultripes TaxID=61616 RepID=A0AAD1SF73_PELCU|nr:Hypothetical predicted protein [Pelobates cultripes]
MLQCSLDDIDNRGWRNNLRIRGLREAEGENLSTSLSTLFNLILSRKTDTPVVLDRVHRSLKPRLGRERHQGIQLPWIHLHDYNAPRYYSVHQSTKPSRNVYYGLALSTSSAQQGARWRSPVKRRPWGPREGFGSNAGWESLSCSPPIVRMEKKVWMRHYTRPVQAAHFDARILPPLLDISWHTLQARRVLKPTTDQLCTRNLKYRWGFPFALIVSSRGSTYTITMHQDIIPFTRALNLAETSIMDWYVPDPALSTLSAQQGARWRSPVKR